MTGKKQPPLSLDGFMELAHVSRETLELLKIYADLLAKWQKRINLVAPSTLPDLWRRHMLDSAQLSHYIPDQPGPLLDLGSGAGFPGLVLALLGRPNIHLVERNAEKCVFLGEVARLTETSVTIHHCSIENLQKENFARFITARAVAPLPKLLDLAAPLLAKKGECFFLKGKKARQELTESRKKWKMTVKTYPSLTDPSGTLLKIGGLGRRNDLFTERHD